MTIFIRGLHKDNLFPEGSVITIGNFDVVHIGHQALLNTVLKDAEKMSLPAVAIIFEPQPLEYFQKQLAPPRLFRLTDKWKCFKEFNLDAVVCLNFNRHLKELSPEDFAKSILHQKLNAKKIVVGDDFRFGKNHAGDVELLRSLAAEFDCEVEVIPAVIEGGERVSSTRIRTLLAKHQFEKVGKLLARPFTMGGKIVRGNQLGRKIGFPTANILTHRRRLPCSGIYVVLMHGLQMHGLGDRPLPGVANLGTRPTVNGTRVILEVHLFDFDEDIYDRYVEVEFLEYLREEVRFATMDLMIEQIHRDADEARKWFKENNEH